MKATSSTPKRITAALAQFFSTMLSPLLMPSYGAFLVLWGSFLSSRDTGDRATILIVFFGITCMLPMFFISALQHLRVVRSKRLEDSKERLYPYLFTLLCYIAACFYLDHVHAPLWFIMFATGTCLACAVSLVVNLRWKISAHMAGMGGIVALIYIMHVQMLEAFNLLWVMVVAIMLTGILGSARMALKHHDIYQVIAGALNGYLSVWLMMTLWG